MKKKHSKFTQIWILASFGTIVIFVTLAYSFLFVDWNDDLDYKTTHYFIGKCNSCNEVKIKAIQDFKTNNKKWFVGGFRDHWVENKFPYSFYEKIEKEDKIQVIFYGCLGNDKYYCYNKVIDSLTSMKHGNRYLENTYISIKKNEP